MAKKFAVIGLGDFGRSIATSLTERGAEVMAIDQDLEIIEEIKEKVTYAVRTDSTDEKALINLGIEKMDAVIISMGEHFEDTVLTVVLLLQMGIKKVVARASSLMQQRILYKLGAHQVITPEFEMARKVASTLINEDVLDLIPLGENYNIVQIRTPKTFVGKTLQEIDLRIRYNLNLITVKRSYKITDERTGEQTRKERIYGVPTATTVLEDEDILIILGKDKDIKKIIE